MKNCILNFCLKIKIFGVTGNKEFVLFVCQIRIKVKKNLAGREDTWLGFNPTLGFLIPNPSSWEEDNIYLIFFISSDFWEVQKNSRWDLSLWFAFVIHWINRLRDCHIYSQISILRKHCGYCCIEHKAIGIGYGTEKMYSKYDGIFGCYDCKLVSYLATPSCIDLGVASQVRRLLWPFNSNR